MKIVLDPGHGGEDPGALAHAPKYIRESDLVLGYAMLLQRELSIRGHVVEMIRNVDRFVSLEGRCAIANLQGADLFVSLHANAAANAEARGYEVWTSPGDTRADGVAQAVIEEVRRDVLPFHLRADREDGDDDREARFYVLLHTAAPALLIELGFLSNPIEAGLLSAHPMAVRYVAAIAQGICRGVEAWGS